MSFLRNSWLKVIENICYLMGQFYPLTSVSRYSINQIDKNQQRLIMVERGIPFYLLFNELHEYLCTITQMSQRDVLLFGFILSRYGVLDKLQFERKDNNRHNFSLILASEDRVGRFNLYDFTTNSEQLVSISELLQAKSLLKRMHYDDLFQIGLSAGKNKRSNIQF